MSVVKVLVVDDQILMRDGLKTILELEPDIDVVGTAGDGREACDMVRRFTPDVVLMDVRMPMMDGVEGVRLIKEISPQTRVIMLTTFDDDDYIINALAHGADGFLLKDIPTEELIEAVRSAAGGQELILPARVAGKLAALVLDFLAPAGSAQPAGQVTGDTLSSRNGASFRGPSSRDDLSPREQEVAALMVAGLNNLQIAKRLGLTGGTIKNYISVIYDKVGTSDRHAAISRLRKRFPHMMRNVADR